MTRSLSTLEQLMFSLVEVWQSSGQRQRVFCQEKDIAYAAQLTVENLMPWY